MLIGEVERIKERGGMRKIERMRERVKELEGGTKRERDPEIEIE